MSQKHLSNVNKNHNKKQSYSIWDYIKKALKAIGIVAIVTIIFYIGVLYNRIQVMENNINGLDGSDMSLTKLKNEFQSFKKETNNNFTELNRNLEDHFNSIENEMSLFVKEVVANEELIKAINLTSDTDSKRISQPLFNDKDVIAFSDDNSQELTAEELIDTKLFVPYNQSGYDVLFYGQYNNNYHWDGECTINNYKNNQLFCIMEAVYDDGELKSYRQIIQDTKQDGTPIWCVSLRHKDGVFNYGQTYTYYRYITVGEMFSFEKASVKDIQNVDSFMLYNITSQPVYSYYNGATKDGKYSDDSGTAVYIDFLSNGEINTYYNGRFKNGTFEDETGNGWIIKYSGNGYSYFKGEFKNGTRKADNSSPEYISENELRQFFTNRNLNYDYIKSIYSTLIVGVDG